MVKPNKRYTKLAKQNCIDIALWDSQQGEKYNCIKLFGSYPVKVANYIKGEESSFDLLVNKEMWGSIEKDNMWNEMSKTVKSIGIVGRTRTGKTALAYKIIESFDKPKFVYKHPKPYLLKKIGFKNITGLGEVEKMQDCVFLLDEPQLSIKVGNNKANHILMRLLSLCGQRNITLIISTSDTRWITRGIESGINSWCIKDLEFDLVKQGSIIKKIVKDNVYLSVDGFSLDVEEYLFHSRDYKKFNGKHTFSKPIYFSKELSCPYRIIPQKTTQIVPQNVQLQTQSKTK